MDRVWHHGLGRLLEGLAGRPETDVLLTVLLLQELLKLVAARGVREQLLEADGPPPDSPLGGRVHTKSLT